MEFLLLWIDELDDALGALRHLAPKIAGFCLAVALFALTGFALVVAPHTTLAIAGVVLTATLFEFARKRRRQQES
jgi:Flp pilus assembly protein TadB